MRLWRKTGIDILTIKWAKLRELICIKNCIKFEVQLYI